MPREERSFRYQKRSREDIKERANMRGGDFDSIFKSKYKLYKVRDGKNLIRILPPTWDDAKHYGYDLWINYNVGVDNQSYLSLSKMKGEKDPLEDARKAAERDGDKELINALKPRQRILMWVIDRQAEDEGPQLFSCPFTLDKAILNKCFDEDTNDTIYPDDPEEGCDVRFYKEGSGLKTDYPAEKIKMFEATPLCDDADLQQDWLDFVTKNPLPDVIQFYDYDHINGVFNGQVGSRDRDEDKRPRRDRDDDERVSRRSQREEEPPFEGSKRRRLDDDEGETKKPRDEEKESPRSSVRERLAERKRPAPQDDNEED